MTADELEAFEQEFKNVRERLGETTFEESHKQVTDMCSILVHM